MLTTLALSAALSVAPAPPASEPLKNPTTDLSKPTLYVIGYAHLDTEWRWTYAQTIKEFIPNTLRRNFPLFEKYPHYIFNFSGSRRYQMMAEYYPDDYAKLKDYIAQGRWFPCGSSVDENDANVPSAESQIRHVLYGNRFFRREFGTASDEFMLPDCFGFPYALPTILAHCGIKGFSTQKLTWGSPIGIPFKVGVWEGPDGSSVMAALDPGAYVGEVKDNLATSEPWLKRINATGEKSGAFVDYHYYGTGDQGGAPKESSVAMVEKSLTTEGPIRVISSHADWMFQNLSVHPEQVAKLPRYKGELLLTEHSSGSISSQAYMKRWNRKNELLADAAERASVAAWWLQGQPAKDSSAAYPADRLEKAWTLVLGSQMHDILPGTSVPKAYEYAWNDECIAANQFADIAEHAVGVVSAAMDTQTEGTPVLLYNPLSIERKDVVECTVPWSGEPPLGIAVRDPFGALVPAQILEVKPNSIRVLILARVPTVGFAVYDVRSAGVRPPGDALKVTDNSIESDRYIVKLDDRGDVSSIFDKSINKELLSAPARLALQYEKPQNWPAWNMDWADQSTPPRSFVGDSGTPKITVTERGPIRATIRVEREHQGSTFTQDISLTAGGEVVEFVNHIDWNTREHALKATFPLAASNPIATYDIQAGAIERETNNPKKYEFPAHQWSDLTDKSGEFGVSILNDSKFGNDKPDDNTLRLTLIYTPGVRGSFPDQGTQDIGRHGIRYAIAGHAGDWRKAQTPLLAARFNQPIRAFVVPKHDSGGLKRYLPLVRCYSSDPDLSQPHDPEALQQVIVTAIKKAEDSDEIVVRLRELTGADAKHVHLHFASAVLSAREVDGQERPVGEAKVEEGELIADVRGYGLKSYAVKLAAPTAKLAAIVSSLLEIPFNADVVSANTKRDDGKMESDFAYPAEQFPKSLSLDGVDFKFGSTSDGQKNAMVCDATSGQRWTIKPGKFSRVEIIAAAASPNDIDATFLVDDKARTLEIQSWRGYIGQWDNRRWSKPTDENEHQGGTMVGLDPGFMKPAPIAWYCSHYHTPKSDTFYRYCYMFRYSIDLPPNAKAITLPKDPNIVIFAATAVGGELAANSNVYAAAPLRDLLDDRSQTTVRITPSGNETDDLTMVKIEPALYGAPGAIRFTTDGSEPNADSPKYDQPLAIYTPTTISAAALDSAGKRGPVASAHINTTDTKPPRILGASAVFASPSIRVEFSEPVEAASANLAGNYALTPAIAVQSVNLSDDGRVAVLAIAQPLTPDKPYTLTARAIKDRAPAHNTMSEATAALTARGPVYRLDEVKKEHEGATIRGVRRLPATSNQPWTLNMFIKMDHQPDNRTVIAGFGKCDDKNGATGRYLCKFASGIHFWSSNADVRTTTPFDLNQWQMITAASDGTTIRIYKDGNVVAEQQQNLSDDEPIINILPLDPWEHKRRFQGEIRELSIWDSALDPAALMTIHDNFKAP